MLLSQLPPPPPGEKWQRGSRGGRLSCQRRKPEAPKMRVQPQFSAQTLTLLPRGPRRRKTPLQQAPGSLATCPSPNPSPSPSPSPRTKQRATRTPPSGATTPTTTPNWSRSSMSRRVAETWRCRARAATGRRGGCVLPSPYRTKRLRLWRRGERSAGDSERWGRGGSNQRWRGRLLENNAWKERHGVESTCEDASHSWVTPKGGCAGDEDEDDKELNNVMMCDEGGKAKKNIFLAFLCSCLEPQHQIQTDWILEYLVLQHGSDYWTIVRTWSKPKRRDWNPKWALLTQCPCFHQERDPMTYRHSAVSALCDTSGKLFTRCLRCFCHEILCLTMKDEYNAPFYLLF